MKYSHRKPRTWTDTLVRPKQQKRNMRFGTLNVRSPYRARSLTIAARELARCKLDLVGVLEVRWHKGGRVSAGDYNFFYGKGNENNHLGTGFFVQHRIVSAVIPQYQVTLPSQCHAIITKQVKHRNTYPSNTTHPGWRTNTRTHNGPDTEITTPQIQRIESTHISTHLHLLLNHNLSHKSPTNTQQHASALILWFLLSTEHISPPAVDSRREYRNRRPAQDNSEKTKAAPRIAHITDHPPSSPQ